MCLSVDYEAITITINETFLYDKTRKIVLFHICRSYCPSQISINQILVCCSLNPITKPVVKS